MNFAEGFLLSLLIFPAACVTGYSTAGLIAGHTAGIRLCLASLAGLGQWLWLVATVNMYGPLNFSVSWAILGGGWILTALLPYARKALLSDLRAWWADRPARWLLLAPLPMVVLLLLPLLIYPGQIFYDGTSNHDSYFWISAAEWLQQSPYLANPDLAKDPPIFGVTNAILGWHPAWGRMGTEGLLALVASAMNVLPIKAYIYGQAGLFSLWLAGLAVFVQLAICRRPPLWAWLLGAALQPLYHFYAANNNIPNLLGALFAPLIFAGFVNLTTPTATAASRIGWMTVTALSLHGLLCSYPEMAPFTLLVAGAGVLLKLPGAHRQQALWPALGLVLGAGLVSLAIQPCSTWRAYIGFVNSFQLARADTNWGNLFEPLTVGSYLPALTTLSITAFRELGPVGGWICSALVVVICGMVWRRAEDRALALVSLLGTFLLVGYTIATDFNYGWQKAAQFSGVFIGGWISTGAFALLGSPKSSRVVTGHRMLLAALTGFLCFATLWTGVRGVQRAEEKGIDVAWLSLRSHSRDALRGKPVEIVGATFLLPFFHSMWSVYGLPSSELSFDSRGDQMGGYLREYFRPLPPPTRPPAAYLVSRAWSESFDANHPPLASGRYHALLPRTNKVLALDGVFPVNGVPHSAKRHCSLTLLPADAGVLHLDVIPRKPPTENPAPLLLRHRDPAQPDSWQELSFPHPWQIRLPLAGGRPVEIEITAPPSGDFEFPLILKNIRITAP